MSSWPLKAAAPAGPAVVVAAALVVLRRWRWRSAETSDFRGGQPATQGAAPAAVRPTGPDGASCVDGVVSVLGIDSPLFGRDKWLGGERGQDGRIYGVPGCADSVLVVDPSDDSVATLTLPRDSDGTADANRTKYKWLRGILAPDGAIYCIPSWARTVLRIDTRAGRRETNNILSVVGSLPDGPEDGRWKYHGAVLAGDGCIYGIPCHAEQVLKIDPSTTPATVSFFGGPFLGRQKWYGGLLGDDGCVYGIPQNHDSVLRVDPATQTATLIGKGRAGPPGGHKWHGGVRGCDGAIYGLPNNASRVLKIQCATGEVTQIGPHLKGGCRRVGTKYEDKYKYLGGVAASNGCIYAMPGDADRVLRIRCGSDEVSLVGRSFHDLDRTFNKWQNGFQTRDGFIFGIPLKAKGVLRIDPRTDETTIVGGSLKGDNKWEGGVLSKDGDMYCMPLMHKHVLKIGAPPFTTDE